MASEVHKAEDHDEAKGKFISILLFCSWSKKPTPASLFSLDSLDVRELNSCLH